MTLRFILTRHAKSDWDDPLTDDHDRPLSKRGRASASAMGKWLADEGHIPDQVLCSSATRTQETWALISGAFNSPPQPDLLEQLYLAPPQLMLDVLRKQGAGQTVMMIGHNPGSGTMASMLAQTRPDDPDFGRYPTCFTTVFEFEEPNWQSVDWGKGKAAATMAPRRLVQD